LDKFESCPRQYHETSILKKWPYVETAEMAWGKQVHSHFEHFLVENTPLPVDLVAHQPFLESFKARPGELVGEERIALDEQLKPCSYFAKNVSVWYRGQIDARKRDLATGCTFILDHKTGKVKNDYTQLKSFAMFEFLTQPLIHTVTVEYYWTQTRTAKGETYVREQLPEIMRFFIAKLHPFADAFLNERFPPRQSGLCAGWCPVRSCEYWTPKKAQR